MSDYVAPAAMSSWRKRRLSRIDDPPSTQLPREVLATIVIIGGPGTKAATHLGQNYDKISLHHRSYLHVSPMDPKPVKQPPIDDPDESDWEPDPSDPQLGQLWSAKYEITFNDMDASKLVPALSLSIGRGSSNLGETRGVDILLIYLSKYPSGVISQHARIRLHQETGVLMIGGLSDDHPVGFMDDNVYINLRAGQWRVLFQLVSRILAGEKELEIHCSNPGQAALDTIRQVRDRAFVEAGHAAPDSRLPVLPTVKPLKRLGDILIYRYIGAGGFGLVGIGIDVTNGEARAVKSITIKEANKWNESLNEARMSLRFSGKPGLLKTFCVRCEHGHIFTPDKHADMEKTLKSCPLPDVLYFVSECGRHDFSKINVTEWTIEDLTNTFHGPIVGISYIHARKAMHRDVTPRNFVVISRKPPVGVVIDYGKITLHQTHTSNALAPRDAQAPEIDGKRPYNKSIDIWGAGYSMAGVLVPVIRTLATYSRNNQQSRTWVREAHRHLDSFGAQSPAHARLANIVKAMLQYDPRDRLTIEQVLERWPSAISEASDSEAETEIEEPPAKVARTSGPINVFHEEASAGQDLLPAAKGTSFDVRRNVKENAPPAPADGWYGKADMGAIIKATLATGPLIGTVTARDPRVRPETPAATSKIQGKKGERANEA